MDYIIDVKKMKEYAKDSPLSLYDFAKMLCQGNHNLKFVRTAVDVQGVDVKEVIDYLNKRTGRNFKHTTAKAKKLINARAKEGFTIDEFKQAVDNQIAVWTGEMYQYLRPETLFGTKMDSYVNNIQTKANDNKMTESEMMEHFDESCYQSTE